MPLTAEQLQAYAEAAGRNAKALLFEADRLLEAKCFARAYFLSVASIEETGKAVLAFEGRGRNLLDPAVERKLRYSFEQHDAKITTAFLPWVLMLDPKDMRDRLNYMVQLMISLKRGREPSMYVDFGASDNSPQEPTVAVTAVNATDCFRLAEACWTAGMAHMAVRKPATASKAQDQFFALSKSALGSLFNAADFWWYFIHRMERGETDIAKTAVSYLSEYKGKQREFRTDPSAPVATGDVRPG